MRYLTLNLIVLGIAVMFFVFSQLSMQSKKIALIASLIVIVLTIIFDPIIVWSGIVDYNRQYTLGLNFWNAPIEDLAYAIFASLIIPLIWGKYDKKQ